ncbi:MAG: glycosyltransferase family 87 protein [Sphingobium sp.]
MRRHTCEGRAQRRFFYPTFTISAQCAGMWELLATGKWLTLERARITAGTMLAVTVLAMIALFAFSHGTLDYAERPLGTDFSDVWTAGLMADQGRGALAWDWPAHYAVQQQIHRSATVDFYGWHYPPPFLMLAWALAQMPYVPALIVWQISTLVPLLILVRRIVPRSDILLFAAGAPVVLVCLGHGQNAFMTAGLLGGGLLLLDRRPWLAGALLGCLVYKPQFAVLIPLVLIARGNWRAFVGAGVSVLLLCGLTLLLWGWPVWQAFLDSLTITRHIVIEQGNTGWEKIPSAFSAMRMWGGGIALSYAVQSSVTLLAIVAAVFVTRRGSMCNRGAAAMAAALLCTPYVLDYDFVLLGVAIAFMVADMTGRNALRWEITVLAFAWAVPIFGRQVTALTMIPLDLIAAIAVLALAVRRAILLDGALAVRSSPCRRSHAVSAL